LDSLSLQRDREDDVPVLRLRGELDRLSAETVDDAVRDVAESSTGPVVLDVSDLEFIDSAGLRTLSRAHNLLARDGRTLIVRAPSASILRLIDLVGLRDILTIDTP
jgi:anti-anti-sigma factor